MSDINEASFWENLLGGLLEDENESLEQQDCARILCMTDRDPIPDHQTLDAPFLEDAINIRQDGQCVRGNRIMDSVLHSSLAKQMNLANKAHRDAIQLIPTRRGIGNYQFMAGGLHDVRIEANQIHSTGKLQGIFASDGLFENLQIHDNVVETQSEHKISINGFLNGTISNNRDAKGVLLPVHLGPLRLGGNWGTGNVWILSFAADEAVQYAPLFEIIPDTDWHSGGASFKHVDDQRSKPQNRSGKLGDTNLYQFPLGLFRERLKTVMIGQMLADERYLDGKVLNWIKRLAVHAAPNRIEDLLQAYKAERDTPIMDLKHQGLRNYFIQALAKSLASMEADRIV